MISANASPSRDALARVWNHWFGLGLLVLGALALILGPLHFGDTRAKPLRIAPGVVRPNGSETFQHDAVQPDTEGHQRPDGVATWGSWIGSGQFTGTHESPWFAAKPKVTILVAGYPSDSSNELEVQFSRSDGTTTRQRYTEPDPGPTWEPWYIAVPAGTVALRIHAVDDSAGDTGWLAFSEPFTIRMPLDWQALAWLQLGTTTCLALVLVYGPGLVWLGRRRTRNGSDVALAIVAGPLVLVVLGLACWVGGGIVSPSAIARVGAGVILVWLAWNVWRRRCDRHVLPAGAKTTAAAGALIVGFCVAKANISVGPRGELYGGLVSRSLEVGGHSDSRVSFHVVQVVAHHLAPFGDTATGYFSPWSFASRGPLAGLVAAPIVLATGALVPRDMPDQPWRPFDVQGFAAYRIALIATASLTALALYGTVATVAGELWAAIAAAAALLAPFFVHEMYFTWPKLFAAALVLVAFKLILHRRPFDAGLTLGFGYLFHPLPLLSAPFVALWLLVSGRADPTRTWRRAIVATFAFGAGVALLVGLWQLVALAGPPNGGQAGFVGYFCMADNAAATWQTWWSSRWQNVANTFVPFHLLAFPPDHESINSVYAPSPAWVRAGFLYWNTLPFGLGAPLWLVASLAIGRACRRHLAVVAVTLLGPALLLVAYWGAADSGLMRHCGQVLFLSTIAVTIWAMSVDRPDWARSLLVALVHPVCFAWRGAEIGVMAFATTWLNGFPHWAGPFGVNDIVSMAVAAVCLVGSTVILARTSRQACDALRFQTSVLAADPATRDFVT